MAGTKWIFLLLLGVPPTAPAIYRRGCWVFLGLSGRRFRGSFESCIRPNSEQIWAGIIRALKASAAVF